MVTAFSPSAVDTLFSQFDRPGSPGCALGVMQDGELIFHRGYGLANLEYRIPITPATVFHVASIAKQFTGMAVALLADAGSLSLDDDLRAHLPEVPDFGATITLRHLLHHTSGLRSDLMLLIAAGWRLEDLITGDAVFDLVKRQRELNFRPGEQFSYCGTGYLLLALAVARVTGQTFATFCRDQIFAPLGMANTQFVDDYLAIIPNRAYAYYPADDGGFRNAVLTSSLVGGTGLFTTVEDLARWDENFYTCRVGGAAVLEQMVQRGRLNDGQAVDYGFGLVLDAYKERPVIVHGGDGAGIHCYLMRFPREHFSVAVLGNYGVLNARQLARRVADLYLGLPQAESPAAQAPVTSSSGHPGDQAAVAAPVDLALYCGRYHSVELDVTWTITLADGRLRMDRGRQGLSELVPTGRDCFSDGWAGPIIHGSIQHRLAFDRDGQEAITGFRLSDAGGTVRNLRFVRL